MYIYNVYTTVGTTIRTSSLKDEFKIANNILSEALSPES